MAYLLLKSVLCKKYCKRNTSCSNNQPSFVEVSFDLRQQSNIRAFMKDAQSIMFCELYTKVGTYRNQPSWTSRMLSETVQKTLLTPDNKREAVHKIYGSVYGFTSVLFVFCMMVKNWNLTCLIW